MRFIKVIGAGLASLVAVFAMASPAAASVQQAVTLDSVDGNYEGSVVVQTGKVKANGFIEDTGYFTGGTGFYVNVTTTTGTYNINFASVNDSASYTFATRERTFPGTFISGKATLCSWDSSGNWKCGASKTVG